MEEIERIMKNISRIHGKMEAQFSKKLREVKITIPQFHILHHLFDKGKATMKELADYLLVSPPAVTELVDKLVKNGLIQRNFSSSDRRLIIVSPTEKGGEIISKIKEEFDELFLTILKEFSLKERKDFLEITDKMEKLL